MTYELEPSILYLHLQVLNQPTEEGDPVLIHIFTVENKSLFESLVNLDFTGSEEILIENAISDSEMHIKDLIGAQAVQTIASVRELPHSKLLWQINWNKLTSPEDIAGEEAQRRLREA